MGNCVQGSNNLILHCESALVTKKFAELEKNLEMNMTKPNYIYTVIERSLSLNVLLWIVLAVPLNVFNKNARN